MMKAPTACPQCLRRAWLLAALGPYIEKVAFHDDRKLFQLLGLSNTDLVQAAAPKVSEQMLARSEAITEERLTEELLLAECWACCRHDDQFPDSLRDLEGGPWALIGRGQPELITDLAPERLVAIIGARRATSYGREMALQLGLEIGCAGLDVISGLSFGIDACAHRGAMEAGRTIAVLGCGPDVAYPASHRSLWRRITENGLVLAEFPPGATPWRWTFPARNRVIAALAGVTVVVEAADKSGSLATADLASEYGRLLGAVPGPVTSKTSAGSNALLARGACVVRDASDILDLLRTDRAES
jgi:DNA processing protein